MHHCTTSAAFRESCSQLLTSSLLDGRQLAQSCISSECRCDRTLCSTNIVSEVFKLGYMKPAGLKAEPAFDWIHDVLLSVLNRCLSAVAFRHGRNQFIAVSSTLNRQSRTICSGVEGGVEIQQHQRWHLAVVEGTHEMVVHIQYQLSLQSGNNGKPNVALRTGGRRKN